MSQLPRGELLRSPTHIQPFYAKVIKNGNCIFWTEMYRHRHAAQRAVQIFCGDSIPDPDVPLPDRGPAIWHGGYGAWLRVVDKTKDPQ